MLARYDLETGAFPIENEYSAWLRHATMGITSPVKGISVSSISIASDPIVIVQFSIEGVRLNKVAYFQSTHRYFTSSQCHWARSRGISMLCNHRGRVGGWFRGLPNAQSLYSNFRCTNPSVWIQPQISVIQIPVSGFSHQFTVDQVHAMYIQPLTDEFTVLPHLGVWQTQCCH